MIYHTANGIVPKNRFEELLPFTIPELSDGPFWVPRRGIESIFCTYVGQQVPELDREQYAAWLQDLRLKKLSNEEEVGLNTLIQQNRETMITPFQTLPHWYERRLHIVQEMLERNPEDVGHILPSWAACTNSELAILIRKLLGATGYVSEFSEAEYEESVPLIEAIIKFVTDVSWQVSKRYVTDSSAVQDASIKARIESQALSYAAEIAILINEIGFKVSDFPSLHEDRNTLRQQLTQLMKFKMVYAQDAGSGDVATLLQNLPE